MRREKNKTKRESNKTATNHFTKKIILIENLLVNDGPSIIESPHAKSYAYPNKNQTFFLENKKENKY